MVEADSFHVECLCCDCQNFASYLNNTEKVLDSSGSTELFQTYPAYVKIDKGEDYIESLQLSSKGLLRHFTSCCKTPIGNMMNNGKMPFIGIPVTFMDFKSSEEKNKVLGPIIMKAFGKYAIGEKPADAHDRFPLTFLPKIIFFTLKGLFKKLYKPSPFFKEGAFISTPKIVSLEERSN